MEVYEELPADLKQCFDTKDIQMLKDTFAKYEPAEAEMWLKKCVDSGLWVPDKNAAAKGDEEGEEQVYENVDDHDSVSNGNGDT